MVENLFDMRAEAATVGEHVKEVKNAYLDVLKDPKATKEDIEKAKGAVDTAQIRFDGLDKEVKDLEAKNKARLAKTAEDTDSPKNQLIKNYADIWRSAANGKKIAYKEFKDATTVNGLGEPSGNNFLPVSVSNDLISEPAVTNPLRSVATYSQLVNLEIPRADIDDQDAFGAIQDGASAKEIALKGSMVKFGRFYSRVKIGLSDALLRGTDLPLVQFAQSHLQNSASLKELARAFADTSASGYPADEVHMSLYDASNAVKNVTGADLFEAISNAGADLADAYQDKAVIFMQRADYNQIIKTLANGSATLYGAQPQQILGYPVNFTSYVQPGTAIIGDFSQYHVNYDPVSSYIDQWLDHDTGITYEQVVLYVDAQVKLASAFRIAKKA